jgi:hypothetical protein
MRDHIDDMFNSDMNKLSMPSELALNAAKVKAAQDEEKPGAEKPDLYARGKGKGKDGKDTDEKEGKGKIPPQFLSKLKGKKPSGEKKASLDDRFAAELHQVVGLEVPSAAPDWERPDVRVAGQATDRIDDHFIGWMRERADEDVVKEAGVDPRKIIQELGVKSIEEIPKKLRNQQLLGAAKALGITAGLGGAAYAGHRMSKKAGVIENPENLKLIDLIRAKSEKLFDKDAARRGPGR